MNRARLLQSGTCANPIRSFISRVAVLVCAAILMMATPANAQLRYTNSTDGTISETVTPCTAPLVRTFSVTDIFTVSDVDIGILLAHTYRGDLQMFLTSAVGTRVQIFNQTGTSRDNFNVLLNDSAAANVTTHTASNDTATASTIVPTYQRNFRPLNVLTGMNGQSANGTWTLEICDNADVDTGTFYQSDLYLTASPATISATKVSSIVSDTVNGTTNPEAIPGATLRYCITLTNAGPGIAAAIVGTDTIPATMAYVAGSLLSGPACATATTAEDDNATGADESDPYGASITGTTISISAASMTSGASFAIAFNTTIN